MSPQQSVFSQWQRQEQQPGLPAQEFNFRATVPSLRAVEDEPHNEAHPTTAGQETLSNSHLDTPDERSNSPSRNPAARSDREATGLSISDSLGALNLDTGQSDVNPCHATRERTETSERSPSPTSFLTGLEQLDLDGDQTTVSSGDEDDSDTSSLYSVRHEPLPQAPIYDSELQNALVDVKEHLSNIKANMEKSPLFTDRGSDFFKQYEQVRMLSQLDCPETRTVGFIGNSGVGKSRSINSLLDSEGLARSVSRWSGKCNDVLLTITEWWWLGLYFCRDRVPTYRFSPSQSDHWSNLHECRRSKRITSGARSEFQDVLHWYFPWGDQYRRTTANSRAVDQGMGHAQFDVSRSARAYTRVPCWSDWGRTITDFRAAPEVGTTFMQTTSRGHRTTTYSYTE